MGKHDNPAESDGQGPPPSPGSVPADGDKDGGGKHGGGKGGKK